MKSLVELTFERFASLLDLNGYAFRKSKKQFINTRTGRSEHFMIPVLQDANGPTLSPSVAIRFDKVEQIFHHTSDWPRNAQKDTVTIGVDLYKAYGAAKMQFCIESDQMINWAADWLYSLFREKGLPYYSAFPNLEALDQVLNSNPMDDPLDGGLPWLRCSKGLIVAKLLKRCNYEELVELYTEQIKEFCNGFYYPQFEALVKDLSENEYCNDC